MPYTEDPRYSDSVCYQMFCYKIEFAVIKKLDRDPSKSRITDTCSLIIRFVYLLESPRRGDSNKYQKRMFF